MKPCTTCGNEIPDDAARCPFCESVQRPAPGRGPRRRPRAEIVTVNLERGRPTIPEAVARLRSEITAHRTLGTRLLRLIHGYGSSGVGGGIRSAVHAELAALRGRSLVRHFVSGDEYSENSTAGRALLDRHPGLRSTLRTDRLNPGITFVEP